MQSLEKALYFAQIFASICLGISCFLPLSSAVSPLSPVGEVYYGSEAWFLFFWTIPVLAIMQKLSNRWLKAIFCVFSSAGGLISLLYISFAATFWHIPLIGFYTASTAIVILVISWLILSVITLKKPSEEHRDNTRQSR